jgi:catechol 2,3-dioxygenase-like lactoylglutathione lyase family enzyme
MAAMSRANPFETATFDHVAVSVSDLDATVAFYGDAFGFVVETTASFPTIGIRTALLRLPSGARLELAESSISVPRPPSAGPADAAKTLGYYHWALEVEDLELACEAAAQAGVACLVPPSNAVREGMRYAYFADPDGNLIEVVELLAEKREN